MGYPSPLNILGVIWVYLQEQEEGGVNSEPCKTPLYPAKSAPNEWPTFLCVCATGMMRMPKMEHQMPLGHLLLPF